MASGKYALKDAPVDYKQLWADLLYEYTNLTDIDIDALELDIENLPVDTFRQEFLETIDCWGPNDLAKVATFADDVILRKVPPLVHNAGFLVDGYHRIGACFWVGRLKLPAIDISKVVAEVMAACKA